MKNSLLGGNLLGTVLLIAIAYTDYVIIFRDVLGREYLDLLFNLLLLCPIILFFSLLTYKMPHRVFQSWRNYARIAMPVVISIIILVSFDFLHSETAGSLGWGSIFNYIVDAFFITLTLTLFTLGSLIQVYRGYIDSPGGLLKLFGFLLLLGIGIPVILLYTL